MITHRTVPLVPRGGQLQYRQSLIIHPFTYILCAAVDGVCIRYNIQPLHGWRQMICISKGIILPICPQDVLLGTVQQ